jgi:hypothetical protein
VHLKAGHNLLAIGYWLLAIGYWLLAIFYWLFQKLTGGFIVETRQMANVFGTDIPVGYWSLVIAH